MLRDLERRAILRDDARSTRLLRAAGLTVNAWRLMPDRAYLLRLTGQQPPGCALFVQGLRGIF